MKFYGQQQAHRLYVIFFDKLSRKRCLRRTGVSPPPAAMAVDKIAPGEGAGLAWSLELLDRKVHEEHAAERVATISIVALVP